MRRAHRHFVTQVLDHPDSAVGWQDRVSLDVLGAYELALAGGDDQAPGGTARDRGSCCRTAVLLNEVHRLFQLFWNVESEELHALEIPLGDAGQGACRRHLQ